MGTHPIFESDFDCLTDLHGAVQQKLFLQKSASAPFGIAEQLGRHGSDDQTARIQPRSGQSEQVSSWRCDGTDCRRSGDCRRWYGPGRCAAKKENVLLKEEINKLRVEKEL